MALKIPYKYYKKIKTYAYKGETICLMKKIS